MQPSRYLCLGQCHPTLRKTGECKNAATAGDCRISVWRGSRSRPAGPPPTLTRVAGAADVGHERRKAQAAPSVLVRLVPITRRRIQTLTIVQTYSGTASIADMRSTSALRWM